MSRQIREPGTLPRPLAVLAALVLTGVTGVAVRLLPAGAAAAGPKPVPAPRPSPAVEPMVADKEPPPAFVGFVDTARDPGFNLPVESLRTGVVRYALGHLIAGGDGCAPRWAGPSRPGGNPVSAGIRGLRAVGGEAIPVFGGPGGRDPAASCTRAGALVGAYRKAVEAFGASSAEFEIRDSADRAAVLRRARAVHALQRERRLAVCFTLPLGPYGLGTADVAMLRATRQAGAEVETVNLLAPLDPGGLSRTATAIRTANDQIAQAQGRSSGQMWRHLALTPVLARAGDLGEPDARKLSAYATRHGLAWLSLRGTAPERDISRILWHTRA